ncbi:hypothetical protein HA466_0102270 [Hirschfeldia incana]|nr:hypothetical protein HA466_0102270 [Hirschfeldia incana]
MVSKNNGLSAALVSILQDRPPSNSDSVDIAENEEAEEIDDSRPIVLVTNGDGLIRLDSSLSVRLWLTKGPTTSMDKSVSSHSITHGETIAASSLVSKLPQPLKFQSLGSIRVLLVTFRWEAYVLYIVHRWSHVSCFCKPISSTQETDGHLETKLKILSDESFGLVLTYGDK